MIGDKKMSEEKMNVTKYTLSSGKEIYFREPKIIDTEEAAKSAGKLAGNDNQAHLMILIQKEMIKRLLVQVDDKRLTALDRNNLDSLFTFKEYNQVSTAIQHLIEDGESEGNLVLSPEIVSL